jgi:ABC-type uncharacterized transport system permease subunit
MDRLPNWADVALVPLVSLALAALISALVILAIGQDPMEALNTMVTRALGSAYGWGYTLYYTTSFIFTGLAVSVACIRPRSSHRWSTEITNIISAFSPLDSVARTNT